MPVVAVPSHWPLTSKKTGAIATGAGVAGGVTLEVLSSVAKSWRRRSLIARLAMATSTVSSMDALPVVAATENRPTTPESANAVIPRAKTISTSEKADLWGERFTIESYGRSILTRPVAAKVLIL